MSDSVTVDIDVAALIAALAALGDKAQPYVNDAAHETGDAIVQEAQARLHRQLGPDATGKTEAGIMSRPADDGLGYIVSATREPLPNLPWWLERGTKKGKGTHANVARPFFYVSALLEESPHLRRIADAVQQAIDDQGLGD